MTLNAVIRRISDLALAHKQIRRFKTGLIGDWFADAKAKYPACCLQYNTGNISVVGKMVTVSFRMYLVDMVHVSEDTKENDNDVLSDMLSVAMDLIAEMNAGQYGDWRLSGDNALEAVQEGENDIVYGWYMDFSISAIFTQNICQIPTEPIDFPEGDGESATPGGESKLVFDLEYVATSGEGSTLTIPAISGKKILLIVREGNPIHKVNINPDPAEYTWDNTDIVLGVPVGITGERFLILYRNY